MVPMHMKKALAHGSSEPPNIIGTSGMTCTNIYCSGLPVVAARVELNSFRNSFRSAIFDAGTFVSTRMFGILE